MEGQDPRELLRGFEARWRDELKSVSLVAELELTRQELNTALFCIGWLWKNEPSHDRAATRIRASYPGSFVVAVSGSASSRIVGGRVLPEIFEAAGLRDDGSLGKAFGETFIRCLEELGLPTFPDLDNEAAYRYVGRMLLHGGVPLDHLDEWFEVAEVARRRLGDVSRSALQAWMVERADEGRLYGATRAVERFLRYGGAFAADFLDRSLDLIDRVRAGDGLDELDVGLARRYMERAIQLREQGELPAPGRRRFGSATLPTRPEVRFDPYVMGVHLVLPPVVDEGGGVPWLLDLEGSLERTVVRASRPGVLTPSTEVPLLAGVGHVDVSRPGEETFGVKLVDLDDPHLVFDASGRRVERTGRLRRDVAWSLHPVGKGLQTSGGVAPRVVEVHESVPRWPGWQARLLDLSDIQELRLEGGRGFPVAADDSARLLDLDVVENVRTADGLEVLRRWPTLTLPTRPGGASWEVIVTALVEPDLRVAKTYAVRGEASELDLGAIVDARFERRPLRVRARGPLGRSLRHDIVVVPELRVAFRPALRTFAAGGLSPARVELSWAGGDSEPVSIGGAEVSAECSLADLDLVVEPPAVGVQHIGRGTTGWRTRPLELSSDEVQDDAGSLVIRVPGTTDLSLQVLDEAGREVQRLVPDGVGRSDGARRFELTRITDTLRTHGSLVLVVESERWNGRVATIRPARLADGVKLYTDRGIIEFRGVPAEGVHAAVYRRLAPTVGAVTFHVPRGDSQLALDEELQHSGPLRVLLRIDDPWVPAPWPLFPARDAPNVFDLDELDADHRTVHALHPLASWLAGITELKGLGGRIGDGLRIFDLADDLRVSQPASVIRYELADPLTDDPAATLVAAADAELDRSELARVIVDTGLVYQLLDVPLDLDQVEILWTRWPGAGLLAVGTLDESSRAFVASRCGPAVDRLLAHEARDVLTAPRIDDARLLDFDEAALRTLRSHAGIAPRHLLDMDSRADDGFALLETLCTPEGQDRLAPVMRQADSLLRYILDQVLPGSGVVCLEEGIRGRIQGDRWQLIPAASLAAATAARLAPRAGGPVRVFTRQVRTTLESLVETVPRLVAADLVMAELAIQGAHS
jgi:hypothetical protein